MSLKEVKKIEIEGGFFKPKNTFLIFPKDNDRISLIYGKNGSGKSSMVKAFSDYKNDNNDTFSLLNLLDENDSQLTLTHDDKNRIFIFDEGFIEKNVRFSPEGLDYVIMFGKQGDFDKEIKDTETKKENLGIELSKKEVIRKTYEDESNLNSPTLHLKNISSALSRDGNWATREMIIKGNKTKSSVTETIRNDIMSMAVTETLEELNKLFEEQNNKLSNNSSLSEKIVFDIDNIKIINNYETLLSQSLSKMINKPTSSEETKKIISIIESGNQQTIEDSRIYFKDGLKDTCPYCLQTVTEEYIKKLLSNISAVFNEEVENHKLELQSLILEKITIPNEKLNKYNFMTAQIVVDIKQKLIDINEKIDEYNNQIKQKQNNIYIPIEFKKLNLNETIAELNNKITEIKEKTREYNDVIDNRKNLVSEAQETNKKIAWYDIKEDIDLYNKTVVAKEKIQEEINSLKSQIYECDNDIRKLSAEKKNVNIAMDKINNDLAYIFFSEERLKLICEDGKYKILSHGKNVKLDKVSVGERNIIALSYFFTRILIEVQEGAEYKDELLVVIDDPISSFDFENKIGIYSFMKSKVDEITNNNSNSKLVIFTHELEAMYSFNKLFEEYDKSLFTTKYYILESKLLNDFSVAKKRNEYNFLLQKMYTYASGDKTDDDELIIGNAMRKVLEAFSTFNYRMGIIDITRNDTLLEKLTDKQKKYFKNLMYRLVLNNESHSEEKVKSIPETNFYEYVSTAEKERTSKDILSFIYLINCNHIKMQFKDNIKAIEDIDTWSKNVK